MAFDVHASGLYPIAPTPFHPDGRVDLDSVARVMEMEFYLECGATGVTVLGIMGEAPKLDADEALELVRSYVKHAAGRRRFEQEGSMRHVSILCGSGGLFLDFETERGAAGAMTGYAFPDMLADVVRLQQQGKRDEAHDLFDAHLPLVRYEQQQGVGLAVRKYVLKKRGAIASDAQRKPASSLTAAARADVDYLLARLSRRDPRAAL